MTFEPGPTNPQPHTITLFTQPSAGTSLSGIARDRYRALSQRVEDLHAVCIPFDQRQQAGTDRVAAENRLQRLLTPRSQGGFGLEETDSRVALARKDLADKTEEQKRLSDLDEIRSSNWRTASTLLSTVNAWLRGGQPPGTQLQAAEVPMPKLDKGGLLETIERLRHRQKEIAADIRRVQASPYPSSFTKKKMREQIAARAALAAPSVANLVEFDGNVEFASTMIQTPVVANKEGGLVGFEQPDVLGLVLWLHQSAIVSALDALVDEESDDASAMTPQARETALSELQASALAVSRDECELVFLAQSQNLPCEHRPDVDPRALLSVRCVVAPPANPSPGTSPQHVITFAGAR